MGRAEVRKRSVGLLLFLLSTVGVTAGQMVVITGTVKYKEARTAAIELEECCGQALKHHRPPLEATIRRVAGTWLVEVGPLHNRSGVPDPLLGELARHYFHLMLAASPATASSKPVAVPEERNSLGLPGRLEWWALGLLAFVGFLGFWGRRRYLARIGKEQSRMQERQKSMEKQLEKDTKR